MKKSKKTFKKNVWSRTSCKSGKYTPHQGKQEIARRKKQIEKGILKI